jgi:hypothetical protein
VTVTAEWIVTTYRQRRAAQNPVRAKAAEIAAVYDGIIQVPTPELDGNEQAMVANLLTQGLDQLAMRIASVTPSVLCPPVIAGQRRSEDNARIRRLAAGWWWQENRYTRKLRKRARWFIGYAGSPVVIRPDRKIGIPRWDIRNPLTSYPSPMPEADDILPDDCIFAVKQTWRWIADRYPAQARLLDVSTFPNPDETYEVLEYLGSDETVMVVVGKPEQQARLPYGNRATAQGAPFVEIGRTPNLVGRCPVVIPTRLSLNDPRGQFDQMPGLYRAQARAMSLWLIGNERAIFPDTWFISRPNETVNVLQVPDGRQGIPGQVKGGDLREVNIIPPPQVGQVIDQLERNMRVTASISSDFGGEAPTNVRTGRAGEQLLKATVDFWMQEAQETLGLSGQEELRLAFATARAYFGDAPRQSQHVYWKWAKGPVAYIPNVHFDSDVVEVAWPYAGSDANALAVRIGQKLGLQVMSKRTAQELDPDIDDPDREHDRITAESMEAALLSAVDQAVAAGQLGPLEVSRLFELVSEHKMSLFDAFQKVHQETQDLQQQQGQPAGAQGPSGAPDIGGGPGAPTGGGPPQPGLMAPGLQQQLGVGPQNPPGESVGPPTPSVAHMAQLMSDLRSRKIG